MGSSMSSIDESKMRSRFGQIKGTPFKENRPTEAARERLSKKAAAQASEGEAQSRSGEPPSEKMSARPGMLIVVGGFKRCQPYLHCGCLLGFRCPSIER